MSALESCITWFVGQFVCCRRKCNRTKRAEFIGESFYQQGDYKSFQLLADPRIYETMIYSVGETVRLKPRAVSSAGTSDNRSRHITSEASSSTHSSLPLLNAHPSNYTVAVLQKRPDSNAFGFHRVQLNIV